MTPWGQNFPEKRGKSFLHAKTSQGVLRSVPRPAGSWNQSKNACRRKELACWCPRCAWRVASRHIKSYKHLEATLTLPNEQTRANSVRNRPKSCPLVPNKTKISIFGTKILFLNPKQNREVPFGYVANTKQVDTYAVRLQCLECLKFF